ncbi:hypothetical protein NLX83_25140 [Allokutzneria sp. A3M-2-11 16]|uniref:hypothetical protein n=1 Tax=Allokutzneria sp. A3M-2-11 16 TaxID=2962043 RepID=UPI0020B7D696|nr:hypothetical protein [Allokutzneria sp. A3M-2-11 16]MCP3802561.1 hypothetical protein [Allokutzneria sp. A3M-2-11 16]
MGPRGYHDFACTHVAPATPRERLVVHGREVLVAEANDGESSVATLIGTYHELMTVFAGPAPRRDRVFSLFNSLTITDNSGGMVVRPRSATLLDTMSEQVVVVVKDYGSVSIPGPRQASALVPRHAGAPTTHGEVWKAAYPGGFAFILGCSRGVAEVHLTGTTQEHLDWLDGINVSWRDAS